jgi:FtsH-binding integral membrane protein
MFGDKIKDLNSVNDEPEQKDIELVSNIFGQTVESSGFLKPINKNVLITTAVITSIFFVLNSSYYSSLISKYIKSSNMKTVVSTLIMFFAVLIYFYFSKNMSKED